MNLIIQKYGGTSVGSLEQISNVAKNIQETAKNHRLIVVVSAMSGETNRLLSLAHTISATPDKRELDVLAATGEQVSSSLLSINLQQLGLKVKSYCGWQLPLITTAIFADARIKTINPKRLLNDLDDGYIIIVAGFQGVTDFGDITTLGRGGSDTSAVALAVALNAYECQIYTDVNGIYDADPNKVITAKRIEIINGSSMFEAASLGAKVLHVRSCELAYRYQTNIRVLSSFAPQDQGTLVMNQNELENYPLINLASEEQQALVNFTLENSLCPILDKLYSITVIDMLHINGNNFSFVVRQNEIDQIRQVLHQKNVQNLQITINLIKFSLIGSGFRSNRQLNQQIWQCLSDSEIFATSHNEISISVLVHNSEAASVRNKLAQLLLNNNKQG